MNKILFVCYDGYKTTNTRVRCYRFSKELINNSINSQVFSFKDDLKARYEGYESSRSSPFERLSLLIRATRRLLKEDSSTVFYIQKAGYFALAPLIASIINRNKIILDYDDYEYEQTVISGWLLRTLCRRAIFCVAASRYLQDFLKRFNKKTYYIPTGVDTQIFRPKSSKKARRQVVFAWVGFVVDKDAIGNLISILEAFDELTRKHREARLEIVGGGVKLDEILTKIKALNNDSIQYKGVLQPDQIPHYLNTVDVGLFILNKDTKYNRSKSPTKLFEYMAKGLAVISSDVGESKSVIKDNYNGLIVKNREELIRESHKLIMNKHLIKKLGKNALISVQGGYSLNILGKQLADIIKSVLSDA